MKHLKFDRMSDHIFFITYAYLFLYFTNGIFWFEFDIDLDQISNDRNVLDALS